MELIAFSSCSSFRVISQFPCLPSPIKLQKSTLFTPYLCISAPSLHDGFSCKSTHLNKACVLPKMIGIGFELDSTVSPPLSPLDGRYSKLVLDLVPYLSEDALIYYRLLVEVNWLLKLSQIPEIPEVPNFSNEAEAYLRGLVHGFSHDDIKEIQEKEKETNHDVKAVEYFLKDKCKSNPEIAKVIEFIHFGCTSEDINNLAYGLMLTNSMNNVMFPVMEDLIKAISNMAEDYASLSMLARTHGQAATPTTLGKELAVFAARLSNKTHKISQVKIMGKFGGAVGNYNAHIVAYPNIDWPLIAKEFVESLGLCFNPYVTQIEPHDYIQELFHAIVQFNTILTDFDRDVWGYVSLSYFKQMTKAGEIGSSTMPHKVNPIDFENSDGNLGMANAILSHLADSLPISRWQRDLTDSTRLRNMGVGFGHCLVAYKMALRGIGKLQVNESRLNEDLNKSWEVLAEAIQSVMRTCGVPEAYEKLKELTRGKAVTKESIREFIHGLELPEDKKAYLLELTPHSYTGAATQLAQSVKPNLNIADRMRP